MQCLKCGRETEEKAVFCRACLATAQSAPVKPGTAVNIPHRVQTVKKTPAKKAPKPEVIIAGLNRTIRWLWIAVAVLCVLFTLTTGALSYFLYRSYTEPDIGSNYSTVDSSTPGA